MNYIFTLFRIFCSRDVLLWFHFFFIWAGFGSVKKFGFNPFCYQRIIVDSGKVYSYTRHR